MFVKVNSAGINGISARMILTEGDVGNGLPSFTLVGYLASEVGTCGGSICAQNLEALSLRH